MADFYLWNIIMWFLSISLLFFFFTKLTLLEKVTYILPDHRNIVKSVV